ncbi:MAG: carbon starvation protein A [Candidatus Omnitrophica bacterium]|nr:carbon starvation protein A [Candidatus Omnitrophota bacterium]
MNSLFIIGGALILFWLGYQFYSRAFSRMWDIDPKRQTPALTHYDGVDYVPAKHWTVLFGHHFASISGAAPIIGPILALSIWGWMPALIWIILGVIFFGGIHDFSALMVSLRSEGNSIADVAKTTISKRAKIVFSIFIWFTLILVIAVFVHFCAQTFVVEKRIVVPTFGLIPIAMLIGFMLYDLKFNPISTTVLGLALLGGFIILGNFLTFEIVKLTFRISGFTLEIGPLQIWGIILLIYAFFASITPVQILLQPRDYLCSFLLLGGVVLGVAGLAVSRPVMQLPAFVGWQANGIYLWPMLFVTVACGAISGFHSLIASGTSSKQLGNEKDARKIGYGAMVMEGIVALLALLIVGGSISKMSTLNQIMKDGGGPVGAFGHGFAEVTKPFLGKYGGLVAITVLNAFILTTLDTATRIGRYLTQELIGIKNRYISTIIVVVAGGALALSGKWSAIWPMFGSANQLVAALSLIVVTAWFLIHGKSVKFTLVPALFMLITTIGALVYQLIKFFKSGDWFLVSITIILLGLAFYMLLEIDLILFRAIKHRKEQRMRQGYVKI